MSQPEEPNRERRRQAAKILKDPGAYKVCEGCGSIVTERTTSCPNCHAYQFDSAAVRVAEQARLLARRSGNSVLSSDLA